MKLSVLRGRRGKKPARKLAQTLLPSLPHLLGLVGRLMVDRRVSLADRALLVGVVAYVLMPLDLVPDVLGVFGFADDLFLVGLAVRKLLRGAGEDVVASHWRGDPGTLTALLGGLDDLGGLLPGPVGKLLRAYADRY